MAGTRFVFRLALLALAATGACRRGVINSAPAPIPERDAEVLAPPAPVARATPDTPLGRLHAELSEPAGFFQSDNVVSNETSYLHVTDAMRRIGVTGGVYIGVGPDQNYSYIAATRPSIAFMFDIRRENAMEHLLFKAVFAMAGTRLEYFCILTARPCPAETDAWVDRPLRELMAYIDRTQPVAAYADSTLGEIHALVATFGIPVDARDSATVARYRAAFVDYGLDVQYSSLDSRVQRNMPGWRALLLGTDREGREGNYLASDSNFRIIQRMHEMDLIVPITGNVAGPSAFAAVGAEARRRGETVSVLYMSNVEQYISRDGSYPRFVENVRSLPRDDRSLIIRSLFGQGYGLHPLSVPGHETTSMLQFMNTLLDEWDAGRITSYADVVFRAYIFP